MLTSAHGETRLHGRLIIADDRNSVHERGDERQPVWVSPRDDGRVACGLALGARLAVGAAREVVEQLLADGLCAPTARVCLDDNGEARFDV